MMILLTGVYRLLLLTEPIYRTLTEPTAEIHVDANYCTPGVHAPTPMDAWCARPHVDGRPVCTPPRRWTPCVHAPTSMDARCARPPGGVHGRTWAYMGVHPTLYSKMSGWCRVKSEGFSKRACENVASDTHHFLPLLQTEN